ncbi:ATP synthase [Marinitoga sp. 1135]|uniref:Flagellar protein export ATPase FliI n=1 Tax=Marinitoga piezophila (strain DSM 14283 / JCM 11233 / KA3) TaxID=443254 RepID=H2J807_MARPK|nr:MULTISPECIES: flagellar protein export ATPase FliI [Marinitoga]AEX85498.1 flagellar protein export ATPase FliI [Marinitoga piezophila KA3]APT75966.1 ATP synthase [Marinitoga sp. 1137]NUU95708.1 ATP synthase [Marinitoga sp. 1135]NUU97640.1 ATP synthase [Marinitoga sp. 1138]
MKTHNDILENINQRLNELDIFSLEGIVDRITGVVIESRGPDVSLGDLCSITLKDGSTALCEVVGFVGNKVLLMPFEDVHGLYVGARVKKLNRKVSIGVSNNLLGRVLDGLGRPMDGKPLYAEKYRSIYSPPPNPLIRNKIEEPLPVGIRAIDGLITLGKGQRIGIFAGSGVGKSTLLGMIARNTSADINVISLIGERGREVREFIERDLGEEGLKRSVVVVSTSDQPALMRTKALLSATTIAEYFRDQGYNVMLMVDSLTRWAMAQREIGLSIGEPPATRGYTPSVFAELPKILERAGNSDKGSITAIYTVLVEGDDFNEPISDTVRGIVDGHILLSRRLAESSHYPAIDVLASISRLMSTVAKEEHLEAAYRVRDIMATYNDAKDLIEVGAYKEGTNPKIDIAKREIDNINQFLRQRTNENPDFNQIVNQLIDLAKKLK